MRARIENMLDPIKLSISKKYLTTLSVLTESPVWVFLLSQKGVFLEIFSTDDDIDGNVGSQLIGRELNQVYVKKSALQIHKIIDQAIKSETTQTFSYELQIDKAVKQFEGKVSPIKLGREINQVLWFCRESTSKNRVGETLEQAKLRDSLTGVDNQLSFYQRLAEENDRCMLNDFHSALVFIDVDDFKLINEKYGTAVGDDVLITLAERLQTHAREGDLVCRLSRDLFALLLYSIGEENTNTIDFAAQIVMNLKQLITTPIMVNNQTLTINASIGITTLPKSDKTVEEMITEAEAAMFESKTKEKGKITTF